MLLQAATGTERHPLRSIRCHPGPEDPGCLEGYEYDAGDDHGHCDQPSLCRGRDDIAEAHCGDGNNCEIKGITEVLHLGVERAFHEIEQPGIYKEQDDDAQDQTGYIYHSNADDSKEHMAPGEKAQKAEYSEYGQDPQDLDEPDIVNEERGWESQEDQGGKDGRQIDYAVGIPEVAPAVRRSIQAEKIFHYKYAHHCDLQPPEHLILSRGEMVGLEHKDGDGNQVQSNDDYIDCLSQRGLEVYHVELNRLSKGPTLALPIALSGILLGGHQL